MNASRATLREKPHNSPSVTCWPDEPLANITPRYSEISLDGSKADASSEFDLSEKHDAYKS
jgi:hypothetical protein